MGCAQHDQAAVMIPDEYPSSHPETKASNSSLKPANDNGDATVASIDPRILSIARAIGQQIAREQIDSQKAVNDNRPEDEG